MQNRWREDAVIPGRLHSLVLPCDTAVAACADDGRVLARVPVRALAPNEARLIGMTLIEAATRAEELRSVIFRGERTPDE